MNTRIPIQHPDWLPDGLESAERCFRLVREGKIPECLKGWMIVTSCMRVLRSVYGDDRATVSALYSMVVEKEKQLQGGKGENLPLHEQTNPRESSRSSAPEKQTT